MPNPPYIFSDRGDVYVYDDLAALYAEIEAVDVSGLDLFDATGRPLRAVVSGYTWTVDEDDVLSPEPERLISMLRTYFERMPEDFSGYRARAAEMTSLSDLIALRQQLAREPAPGFVARLFRRSWG